MTISECRIRMLRYRFARCAARAFHAADWARFDYWLSRYDECPTWGYNILAVVVNPDRRNRDIWRFRR